MTPKFKAGDRRSLKLRMEIDIPLNLWTEIGRVLKLVGHVVHPINKY